MAVVESLGLGAFRRRLVVGSFPRFSSLEEGLAGLRFVQADPIRSPARAQDLILRQRVEGYFAGELEEEFPRLEADEGYLFAYGFMAREVWRILRRRSGGRLKKLERQVLEAVSEMGKPPRGIWMLSLANDRYGTIGVVNLRRPSGSWSTCIMRDICGFAAGSTECASTKGWKKIGTIWIRLIGTGLYSKRRLRSLDRRAFPFCYRRPGT